MTRSRRSSFAAAVRLLAAVSALAASGSAAWAEGPYALVTGRRDPKVIIVDLAKAMDPANNATPKAIVSRVRVSPDVPAIEPSRVDAKFIGVSRVPAQALPNNLIDPPR